MTRHHQRGAEPDHAAQCRFGSVQRTRLPGGDGIDQPPGEHGHQHVGQRPGGDAHDDGGERGGMAAPLSKGEAEDVPKGQHAPVQTDEGHGLIQPVGLASGGCGGARAWLAEAVDGALSARAVPRSAG